MISDVVMNEKIDQQPDLFETQELIQKAISEKLEVLRDSNTQIELQELNGNFIATLEFGEDQELKKKVFEKLNEKSQDCPDPQELLDLLNPNAQFGENMNSANPGINLQDFQGGEGWQKFMGQMAQKHGIDDLGKREGLPLADQFYGSDGNGGMQVFDLKAELAQMEEDGEEMTEEGHNEGLELGFGGAYVTKKNKQK